MEVVFGVHPMYWFFWGTSVSEWIIVVKISQVWEKHSFTKEEDVC
jgi:hypothetical protein